MQKIKNKQPIHMNLSKKGKLRRITWEKINASYPDSSSLVISANGENDLNNQHVRQRQNFFLRKYAIKSKREPSFQSDFVSKKGEGAFRAIHTACPFDSIKGFPLRSVTPVKPFRRGIRAISVNQKALDLDNLQGDRPVTRLPRHLQGMSNTIPNRSQLGNMSVNTPESSGRQISMDNYEQFFMYKDPRFQKRQSNNEGPESARVVSGIKIEPFKKYNIREFHRAMKDRS